MQRLEARKRKEKHDKALGIVVQGYNAGSWREQTAENKNKQGAAYRTTQYAVPLVPSLLDMILQGSRIQGLQKFKTTEQFSRNRHDCTPVIEFATVLLMRICQ